MKHEGDHSIIMHGIYSDFSGHVEIDTTTSAEVVSYKDNFYYNFSHFSKRGEDVHFFVKMNIVGYYSLLIFPEKRGEIAMYRSRICHFPVIVRLIKDLFFPEKNETRLFKDEEGYGYQVLLFDPHYLPRNHPEIKGPKPIWLDPEELQRIIKNNPDFLIDKPFSSYKVEEILNLFIGLNRKKGKSLYESNLDYLEGF
jgi:hypothetical protein